MLDTKLHWRKAHVKKKREELGLKYKTVYWLCWYTISWCWTNNIEACVDLRHTAVGMHETKQHWRHSTISKQGYLGTSLKHVVSIRNADLHRDLQMEIVTNELESSLRSMKKGFSTTSTSRRSSCLSTVNWCKGLKEKTFWAGVVIIKSRAQWSAP